MNKETVKRLLRENGIAFEELPPTNKFVNALKVETNDPLDLQGLSEKCCQKCEDCDNEGDCNIENRHCWVYIIFNAAEDLLGFRAEIG